MKINIIGGKSYFLLCDGGHNYLCTSDEQILQQIRGLLFMERVALEIFTAQSLCEICRKLPESATKNVRGDQKLFKEFTGK